MMAITMIDTLEQQKAALIHLASTCDDQGLAICIENVAKALDEAARDLESDGIVFCDKANSTNDSTTIFTVGVSSEGKCMAERIVEGMEELLDTYTLFKASSQQKCQ